MKLLLDENLSPRLVGRLAAAYPAPPPKVLWLAVGNVGTEAIAQLLEARRLVIEDFAESAAEALLIVELPNQQGS